MFTSAATSTARTDEGCQFQHNLSPAYLHICQDMYL
jgi:hypothetical protein